MKVLVACEYSGTVRDAFIRKGHEAISCDLMDTDIPGPHYKGDIFDILDNDWDLMIAHPPCTYLCSSGARWLNDYRYPTRRADREEAARFFMKLFDSKVPKVCCENPVGYMSTYFRKPDQYIQPYQFGDATTKKTGLWLKNLPKLTPTSMVTPEVHVTPSGKVWDKWYSKSPATSELRSKYRSKTFQGIADAMAEQWG